MASRLELEETGAFADGEACCGAGCWEETVVMATDEEGPQPMYLTPPLFSTFSSMNGYCYGVSRSSKGQPEYLDSIHCHADHKRHESDGRDVEAQKS
jgi:hypothetical protein